MNTTEDVMKLIEKLRRKERILGALEVWEIFKARCLLVNDPHGRKFCEERIATAMKELES